MKITPAIIPTSWQHLEEDVSDVQSLTALVQVDVTDGVYVPESSWPYSGGDVEMFQRIVDGDEALPFWKDIDYEIDMMIARPQDEWQKWISAGASKIIFHLDSTEEPQKLIEEMKAGNVQKDSLLHVDIGVAVGIDTDLEKLWPLLSSVDYVQCMGIKNVGFQGQEFDEKVLQNIRAVKEKAPNMPISVDGSMNEETIPLVRDVGAERVAVGSALYESEDIHGEYKNLSSL